MPQSCRMSPRPVHVYESRGDLDHHAELEDRRGWKTIVAGGHRWRIHKDEPTNVGKSTPKDRDAELWGALVGDATLVDTSGAKEEELLTQLEADLWP